MVGKKAQKDIQFYMEVGEVQTDLNQARGRSDRDEMEREQQERRLKMKLSKTFEAFFKRIEEETNSQVDFEVPIYHLGFSGTVKAKCYGPPCLGLPCLPHVLCLGVPHKTTVRLMPTSHCLVNLTEQVCPSSTDLALPSTDTCMHALAGLCPQPARGGACPL